MITLKRVDLPLLQGRAMHYWALGGKHSRTTLSTGPQIIHWPGTPQGRGPTGAALREGRAFVNNDTDTSDTLGHGTAVAGIIADAIDAVFEDTSVSEIFGGANQS